MLLQFTGTGKIPVLSANLPNVFVTFVEDNATKSSIRYFENNVSYFVQNRRK